MTLRLTPFRRAVISGLFTLLLLEGAFRLWAPPEPVWLGGEVYPDNPRGTYEPCGEGRYCLRTDRSLHGCQAEVDPQRPQVLIVGDSFTVGTGVPVEAAWSSLLELPGMQRRNCAVIGDNLEGVRRQFRQQRQRFRPHLTLYGMVLNDLLGLELDIPIDSQPLVQAELEPGSEATGVIDDWTNLRTQNLDTYLHQKGASFWPTRMLLHSHLARALLWRGLMARIGQRTEQYYQAVYRSPPHLERAGALVAEMAAQSDQLLVVLFPLLLRLDDYPLQEAHQAVARELARRQIPLLDLLPVFAGQDADTLIVHATDRHPNEWAHHLAATAIGARLRRMGVDVSVADCPLAR